ncbi:DNA-3-methyladenine glycosylase family protein [Bradyrhizobium tropiciagri]|uniref:DNA-3-methyladenine glycosylase family protein n=1 Tax=Bradyrhizobium tropiciagri TaxID=312253 RepID=UPI00201120EE|nr:DNA-3-methyladenine glycosylase [Bradyrhizobium tropiciagri]
MPPKATTITTAFAAKAKRESRRTLKDISTIRLSYQSPFDWPAMLAFFGFRAVEGVECVTDDAYIRTIRLGERHGTVEVRHAPESMELVATIYSRAAFKPDDVTSRLRRTFDLDADLACIGGHLSRDPFLARLIAIRPAIRVPGHWDPFETALRAVLGQQVSLVAARRLNARLVDRAGMVIGEPAATKPHRLFPTPQEVLAADMSNMGMPGARVRTLQAVSEAFLTDPRLFERSATVEETIERLCAIKGIGPWTAQYIAIRACREPDGFPAGDAGLLRGTATEDGTRPSVAELTRRAETWRPWRAYAAHHIWAEDEDKVIRQR